MKKKVSKKYDGEKELKAYFDSRTVDIMLPMVSEAVGKAVDEKINGKLLNIKNHLDEQDKVMVEMKQLLEDKKFLVQLWAFIKFLGGIIVASATAFLAYKKLIK